MACFIQAAYLLELDRQEKRDGDAALAPKWWKPFKYKVVEELVDERDESIFGARLEWDRYAAFSDLLVVRPRKAPKGNNSSQRDLAERCYNQKGHTKGTYKMI